jgi:LysM repeat protein
MRIVSGDTIQSISQKLNVPISALEQSNAQISDFNSIIPGEVFNSPATPVDKSLIICGEQYYRMTEVSQ